MTTVLYFAAARELAQRSSESVYVEAPCTVEAFAQTLAALHPALAPYLSRIKLAVNGEYAVAGTLVRDRDEVAVIPPVAGG